MRRPLANLRKKDYFCDVVSEDVKIYLKNRPSIGLKFERELFVQCNQSDCQYVDLNEFPCPLRLDLFAKEIKMREENRRARRMGF